ncbi:CHAD domain-containing protein [Paraburkholderia sp. BL27I4N3]|uniref:CHAD domain-containing protein n=1 Tax=Paraburkholderia sp. BL27I4N3 TaxID=1938805 RepID=UPI000E234FA9|nr:CHAD domain-containing protein [Paraburkholderia sp. BL27I4N3]REE23186.1 CHAD domain-containing protein [Paraburkholderia sp. BL27I4N3]
MNSPILMSATAEAGPFTPISDDDSGEANSLTVVTSTGEAFVCLATSISADAARRARALHLKADPEVLHKLRVALRRLRSLWWAYEPLLDRKDSELRRGEFKSLANAAGKTRDWDVLRELLGTDLVMQHAFASLLESVDRHRADALSFSRQTIGNAGVAQVLQRALAGARRQLESRTTNPAIAGFAEERVESAEKALKKRAKRAIQPEHPDYAALHDVRIAGKKLRYLLEFFSPVLDGSHQATIELLTSVQDELGKLNDFVTSETLLREYALQLGGFAAVEEAVRHLGDQKKRRMCIAHEMLRTTW